MFGSNGVQVDSLSRLTFRTREGSMRAAVVVENGEFDRITVADGGKVIAFEDRDEATALRDLLNQALGGV